MCPLKLNGVQGVAGSNPAVPIFIDGNADTHLERVGVFASRILCDVRCDVWKSFPNVSVPGRDGEPYVFKREVSPATRSGVTR